jgi:hypothetical protein
LELYRTVARNLARPAKRTSLTLCDLDLRATVASNRESLTGIGCRSLRVVIMKILHREQMELGN